MKRLIPCLALLLGAGCSTNNGTMDATMVLKCFEDTKVEIDGADVSVREVYKEFAFDFTTAEANGQVMGLLNNEAELQVSAIYTCVGDCRLECGLPPSAAEGDFPPEPINLERIIVTTVMGREEVIGVEEEDQTFHSPAAYLSSTGPKVDDGGSTRCMTKSEYETELNRVYSLGATFGEVVDLGGYAVAEVNTERSGFYDYQSEGVGDPLYYDEGVGPSTMDDGCYYLPWANMILDRTTDIRKGDDITGRVEVYNQELPLLGLLVDLYGTGGPGTPAEFSITRLPWNDVDVKTVVTENDQPGEIGL